MYTTKNSFSSLFLLLLIFSTPVIKCFNVDTDYPIIFKPPYGDSSEMYFGLSLDMQTVDTKTKYIIGAPKANSTLYGVKQSGAVFVCDFVDEKQTICREIDMNYAGISPPNTQRWQSSDPYVRPTKNMFLGGSVVSRPNSAQTAVCAHLWSFETSYANQINPTGSCFLFDARQRTTTTPDVRPTLGMFPLTDINAQYKYGTYYYSHAMSGFSASFSESGNHLFLGSPGFFQWRGSFLEIDSLDSRQSNTFVREKYVLNRVSHIQTESYFGYAIVSGHFLSGIRTSIVSGAPRDLNYRGRVYIYNLANSDSHREDTTVMYSYLDGTKMGEYFGASLLAVNVNNDLYTDLLVGAPFYSASGQSGDRGRVYVYISNGNGFNDPKILTGSDSPNARFGTTLANLGDINNDGYNDVAIGAPYEDDSGAVYIYHGSRQGIDSTLSQKISSQTHFKYLNLRGFGISISGNRDIDGNHYPDILIGSYLSNSAILLRSKPIAKISLLIKLSKEQIDLDEKTCPEPDNKAKNVPCIRLAFCVKYEGEYIPAKQVIKTELVMDSRRADTPRCYTVVGSNQKLSKIVQNVSVSANTDYSCFDDITVYVYDKSRIDDVFTPIQFFLSYDLVFAESSAEAFCTHCPVVYDKKSAVKELIFETGCGSDKICVSTLELNSFIFVNNRQLRQNNDQVIEGLHKNLTLLIDVTNFGEKSYMTRVLVNTKPVLEVLKQPSECKLPKTNYQSDGKHTLIECDVGNPLETNSGSRMSIPFDLTKLDTTLKHIELNIEVSTASDITPNSKTISNHTVDIKRSASIEVIGRASKSEILYESEANRESDVIPFSSSFQIIKHNSSVVDEVFIEILLPGAIRQQPIIFRPSVEAIKGVSVNCNRTLTQLPVLPDTAGETHSADHTTSGGDLPDSSKITATKYAKRRKRDATNESAMNLHRNDKNTIILNCDSGRITCYKLECFAGPFGHDRQSAQFIVNSALNVTSIESLYGKKYDTIVLALNSTATVIDQELASMPASDIVSTDFVAIIFKRADLAPKELELNKLIWIIIFSILAGLIILIPIIIALIHLGFFRRHKPEATDGEVDNDNKANTDSKSLMDVDSDNACDETDAKC